MRIVLRPLLLTSTRAQPKGQGARSQHSCSTVAQDGTRAQTPAWLASSREGERAKCRRGHSAGIIPHILVGSLLGSPSRGWGVEETAGCSQITTKVTHRVGGVT